MRLSILAGLMIWGIPLLARSNRGFIPPQIQMESLVFLSPTELGGDQVTHRSV
jgi:hypothetical protein